MARQDWREPLGVRVHSFTEQFRTLAVKPRRWPILTEADRAAVARVLDRGVWPLEGLEVDHQPEGSLHLGHASRWYDPRETRTVGRRVKETGWVQRANLKAQEYGVDWKAGFLGRHADVRWIVTRHIPARYLSGDESNR